MRFPRSLCLIASVCSVCLVAACGDLLSPGSERSRLDTNRQKWLAHGYVDYQFTLQAACFCAINGPVRIVVQSDSILTVTQISTGKPLDAKYLPTINKLFDFVEQGIAQGAATLRVTYDPTIGYPTQIDYDGSVNIADDEVTYIASDVTPVARPAAVRANRS